MSGSQRVAAGILSPDCKRHFRVIRCGPLAVMLLAGCVAPPPKGGTTPVAAPAVPLSAATPDASYDWHRLVIIPFGTVLSASKVALHEVLLFHDQSHNAEGSDTKDCYTVDAAPPRFVDQRPDEYLLCFSHDRLNRIDAAVRLTAPGAAETFARACGLWLKNSPLPPSGDSCVGRDGEIAFSAHLTDQQGEPNSLLSVTLAASSQAEETGGATPAP